MANANVSFKLAKRMSRLGNDQGLTVKGLSLKSDVSTSTIRAILNTGIKTRNPKLSTIVKLAEGLKTPLTKFVDFNGIHNL